LNFFQKSNTQALNQKPADLPASRR